MRKNTKLTIQFYLKHLARNKFYSLLPFLAVFVAIIAEMIAPFFYKEFVDNLTAGTTENLFSVLIFIMVTYLVGWVAWRFAGYGASYIEPKIMSEIYDECFEYTHKHSYDFFNNNFSGALVKKINRVAAAFEDIIDNFTFAFLPLTIRIVFAVSVMFSLSIWLGVVSLIWVLIFLTFNYYFSVYKLKKFDLQKAEADTKITAGLSDTIINSINIKLFASQNHELQEFKKLTNDWRQKTKTSWFVNNHVDSFQHFLMLILEFGIFIIAISMWQRNLLTVGDFVLIQSYIFSLFMHIWDFGRTLRKTYERFADAEEMVVVLNTPIDVKDKKDAGKIEVNFGKVEFKNVSFSYSSDDVIKNLSFRIKPSEKIALIGSSGGGKSTIVKLILRLFDIDKGAILIDGQDISEVTQDSLREQVALVPQDPILFHRTLMENIRYGRRDASDKEVFAAAKLAHCHEFISSFKHGYQTFVGERGVKLSGGERQRVAIARAILSNAKILILDEATSSLDSESERLIQDALKNLMKNKTTLVIAHRLSTIVQMDRILVLKEGKIVEEGDHASLVAQEEGLYRKLWELQSKGYL